MTAKKHERRQFDVALKMGAVRRMHARVALKTTLAEFARDQEVHRTSCARGHDRINARKQEDRIPAVHHSLTGCSEPSKSGPIQGQRVRDVRPVERQSAQVACCRQRMRYVMEGLPTKCLRFDEAEHLRTIN